MLISKSKLLFIYSKEAKHLIKSFDVVGDIAAIEIPYLFDLIKY